MLRHDRTLLEIDVRDHHAIARDQPSVQRLADLLLGHVVPAVECDVPFSHSVSPLTKTKTARLYATNWLHNASGKWITTETRANSSQRCCATSGSCAASYAPCATATWKCRQPRRASSRSLRAHGLRCRAARTPCGIPAVTVSARCRGRYDPSPASRSGSQSRARSAPASRLPRSSFRASHFA